MKTFADSENASMASLLTARLLASLPVVSFDCRMRFIWALGRSTSPLPLLPAAAAAGAFATSFTMMGRA